MHDADDTEAGLRRNICLGRGQNERRRNNMTIAMAFVYVGLPRRCYAVDHHFLRVTINDPKGQVVRSVGFRGDTVSCIIGEKRWPIL